MDALVHRISRMGEAVCNRFYGSVLCVFALLLSGCFTQKLPEINYVGKTKREVLEIVFSMPDEPRVFDDKVMLCSDGVFSYYRDLSEIPTRFMEEEKWELNWRKTKRSLIPVPWFHEDQAWKLTFDSSGNCIEQEPRKYHFL